MIGSVAVWNTDRGFGFVDCEGGPPRRRAFVHISVIVGLASAHDHAEVGDLLEFDLDVADRAPRAVNARAVKRAETAT